MAKIVWDLGKERPARETVIRVLRDALSEYVAPRTPVDVFVQSTYTNIPDHLLQKKIDDVTAKVLLAGKLESLVDQLELDLEVEVPADDRGLQEKLEVERNVAEAQETKDAEPIELDLKK